MDKLQFINFKSKQKLKSKHFIPFIVAGDPSIEATEQFIFLLSKLKVSAIEIGIPFSDPIADGVVNQKAMNRALSKNISMNKIFNCIIKCRKKNIDTPIIFYTYLNPVYQYGLEKFASKASQCKINAILVVDLPPEESFIIKKIFAKYNISLIFLVSPTTSEKRINIINKMTSSFIYYIPRAGITGSKTLVDKNLLNKIKNLKEKITWPLAVGFGISEADQARKISQVADIIIIGSAIVKKIDESKTMTEAKSNVVNFCQKILKAFN